MKITDLKVSLLRAPLRTPFKTALRTVENICDVVVQLHTDEGLVGWGEAPPTAVITGETIESIQGALLNFIRPALLGLSLDNPERIFTALNQCMVKNTSAKAAADMAIYDLLAQKLKLPLYQLLGGYHHEISTDLTISVNPSEKMVFDSQDAVSRGFDTLKIKVGLDYHKDIRTMTAIRKAVGPNIRLRVDANQGWTPKDAVKAIGSMEDQGLDIELVEQPVAYHDLEGMIYVTAHTLTPILADESVFSPADAVEIIRRRGADLINIKLMKTGGIHNALQICNIAEIYGVECMIGCMLESKISVSAAAHLAAAKKIITKIDLDGPGLCSVDPVIGGPVFNESKIRLNSTFGLGISGINPTFHEI